MCLFLVCQSCCVYRSSCILLDRNLWTLGFPAYGRKIYYLLSFPLLKMSITCHQLSFLGRNWLKIHIDFWVHTLARSSYHITTTIHLAPVVSAVLCEAWGGWVSIIIKLPLFLLFRLRHLFCYNTIALDIIFLMFAFVFYLLWNILITQFGEVRILHHSSLRLHLRSFKRHFLHTTVC